jgi:hypothetical protein
MKPGAHTHVYRVPRNLLTQNSGFCLCLAFESMVNDATNSKTNLEKYNPCREV